MFDRLKRVFSLARARPSPLQTDSAVFEWANVQGLSYSGAQPANGFVLAGKIGNKPWKLELGRASRDYIAGEELRARADLKLHEDVSVLIMNRHLKETLEKRAYEMYTDTLQTTADPSLPEEMRWLAMYPEAGWNGLEPEFWKRYAVLAEKREQATAWLDPHLAELLMSWPEPAPNEQVPFILMLMRGKAYLRMQYTPADMPTLAHAVKIFTYACEAGLSGLTADILL